jgi:hypothetical protein
MLSTIPTRRVALVLSLGLALTPLLAQEGQPRLEAGKLQQIKGKVVPLQGLLKKIGSNLEPKAAPHWLALVSEDGHIYPLIEDEGARMFFTDPTVCNRPMRLTGRLFADTHLLQVLDVHSYRQGQLHEIYYWCDICAIRRRAGGICECCGGPMHLKEEPAK